MQPVLLLCLVCHRGRLIVRFPSKHLGRIVHGFWFPGSTFLQSGVYSIYIVYLANLDLPKVGPKVVSVGMIKCPQVVSVGVIKFPVL